MYSISKVFEFETNENLNLKIILENLGITIIGTPESKSELLIDIISSNEINPNLIQTEYDKNNNSLTIDFSDFEKNSKIKKSEIILKIPHKTTSFITGENGKIHIKHLEGNQILKNENGKILIEKIIGNLEVTNENGPIKISNILGNIKSKTENAMIMIEKVKGKIDLKSENSLIKVVDSKGEIICKNENGLIKIANSIFENAEIKNENGMIHYETGFLDKGSIKIKNERGKISLYIPQETPFDITAKTSIGKIQIDVKGNIEKLKDNYDEKIYHIVNGDATLKIDVKNEAGNIKINNEITPTFTDKLEDLLSSILIEGKKSEKITKLLEEKIGKKIGKTVENIEEQAKKILENNKENIFEKTDNIGENIKSYIEKALNKAFQWVSEREKPKSEEIKKRSRMKILNMLQDGKITPEQAEKLLNALEKDYE